jgi:hypothetical protein
VKAGEPAPATTAWPNVIDYVGVVVLCGVGFLSALFDVFLVPLYAGKVLVPLAVVLAVVGNVLLPRLSRALVPATWAAAAPVAVWVVLAFVLGFTARPEGDVLLPGGGYVQWVGLGMVFGGVLAGIGTVVTSMPPPAPRARPARPAG